MGVVRDESGRLWTLGGRSLIGRSRSCALRVSATQVSGEHACLFWQRERWWVRDLGSTNGSWLGHQRLEPGQRRELEVGQPLSVGGPVGGPEGPPTFVLIDASPPGLRATELESGARSSGGEDLLHLPDDEHPVWTVYDDGARWLAERDGVGVEISDQDVLRDGACAWRLELPARAAGEPLDTTESDGLGATPLELCAMRFDVSRDEEHVDVTLTGRGQVHPLTPRAFHYLLLTLARRRLEDRRRGMPPAEEGWIYADELARKLVSTKPKINLDVCRARQQLAAVGILGAGRIVERRATSSQIRIGLVELEVVRAAD